MGNPEHQLQGELWQILTHAFANSLVGVGLVMVLVGTVAFAIRPNGKLWLRIAIAGAALAVVALTLHLIAWI